MLLNVSQLLMEASGSLREYRVSEPVRLFAGSKEEKVLGEVRLLKTSKSIWVSASLKSKVNSQCDRCLEPFRQLVDMAIEEEYFPILDPTSGVKTQVQKADKDTLYIDENQILDLKPLVQQYAAVSFPMKPLCRGDCAGLCSNCGMNLNNSSCNCDNSTRDPRWDALLDLVPNKSGKNF